MDQHCLTGDQVRVTVQAQGAQMSSIVHQRWGEMLWQAEPIWPQHAPNLFPIVGQLAGDQLHYNGASYPLPRHGFARGRRFEWLERGAAVCRLALRDDAQTQAAYPFAFHLEIVYALEADKLHITYIVGNPGAQTLPAAVGAHPAFRWPLADGVGKDAHWLEFAEAEPAPIRRLNDGLLRLEEFATPVDGHVLHLRDDLFTADAIIMDRIVSRAVRYAAPETPAIDVAWDGFRELGIWSKPGAAFVCIEPWYGYASPVDFDGPFDCKPGLMHVSAGGEERFTMSIAITDTP